MHTHTQSRTGIYIRTPKYTHKHTHKHPPPHTGYHPPPYTHTTHTRSPSHLYANAHGARLEKDAERVEHALAIQSTVAILVVIVVALCPPVKDLHAAQTQATRCACALPCLGFGSRAFLFRCVIRKCAGAHFKVQDTRMLKARYVDGKEARQRVEREC